MAVSLVGLDLPSQFAHSPVEGGDLAGDACGPGSQLFQFGVQSSSASGSAAVAAVAAPVAAGVSRPGGPLP
ncbi:hypothetical protein ABGB16_33135, partial [Micromonospora sp. B11E3]|uniref:hypothetical protein n=1 Tax=Micromonospora sp. B11E3 TaxID=3153562 RepID=UPI00325F0B6C